jgi:hypothetical protein
VARLYAGLGVDPDFRPAGVGEVVNASSEPAPDLPEDLVRDLRDYFAASDRELAAVLDRDVPWG